MKLLWSVIIACTVCILSVHASGSADVSWQAYQIEAAIAELESESINNGSRATLELALDVLRAKLADIRTLILNISFSGADTIESEIAVIESKVSQLGLCNATPITQAGTAPAPIVLIETVGITIDSPGHYCLAKDLDATGVEIAITITVSHVTLDLNKKTIIGDDETTGVAIDNGLSDVIVKNGQFVGMDTGVVIGSSDSTMIAYCIFNNVFSAIVFGGSTNGLIKNCSAHASSTGFFLDGATNCVITACTATDCTTYGFRSRNGTANLIQQCVAEDIASTSTAFSVDAAGFTLGGTESCSKIVDCVVDSVTTTASGLSPAYGIKVQTLTGSFDPLANGTITTSALIQSIAWSPDEHYLAVGTPSSIDTNLQVYTLTDVGAFVLLSGSNIAIGGDVNSVSWSSDGQFLAVGTEVGGSQIGIYSFVAEDLTLVTTANAGATVESISWSGDDNYLLVGTQTPNTQEIQIWSFASSTLTLVTQISSPTDVNSVEWAPNGQFFAAGNSGGDIFVYSFNGATITLLSTVTRVASSINGVAWSPHGNFLAIAADDTSSPAVYPVSSVGTLGTAINTAGGATTFGVDWSPDGRFIVYGGASLIRTAQLINSGLLVIDSATHGVPVHTVSWSQVGHYIALGGESAAGITGRGYSTQFIGATGCIVKDCVVSCVSGGSGTAVGISASSNDNLAIGNVVFNSDISYAGLANVYRDGYFGTPTLIQNRAIPPL